MNGKIVIAIIATLLFLFFIWGMSCGVEEDKKDWELWYKRYKNQRDKDNE